MHTLPDFFEGVSSLRDARHIDKTMYLGSDPFFYEFNYSTYKPTDELCTVVQHRADQTGRSWRIRTEGVWTHVVPLAEPGEALALPTQGWKIHVSANNLNCSEILDRVSSILLPLRTQFKFANDIQTLRLLTAKRWPRGGSGKFMTIYPLVTDDFLLLIERVFQALQGYQGSYILSDRRYKDSSCVYFRYGSIQSNRILDPLGRGVEVLTSPTGNYVFDRRHPFYDPPHWVTEVIPEPEPELSDEEMSLNGGRFTVESALAFSNTGGVYLARDNDTDEMVVIKEARPGVELSRKGEDATVRLAHEADMLRSLNDTGITPRLIMTFHDWENFYLVEEHLDAKNMRQIMLDHSPLIKVRAVREDSESFFRIFNSVFVSLLKAIGEFHARGIVMGDLSPMNILVSDETLTVRIIDLEGAFFQASEVRQEIHTPGFRTNVKGREKESNANDDLYAVAVIMLYSMFPIAAMAYLREDLLERVLPVLISDIGWEKTPVADLIQRLAAASIDCTEAASILEKSVAIIEPELLSSQEAESYLDPNAWRDVGSFLVNNWREDKALTLFPIDPFGQTTNPTGLFFGSSGIVWALAKCGIEVPSGAMDRYRAEIRTGNPAALAPGLMTGAAGVATALMDIGEADLALPYIDSVTAVEPASCHHSLYYGLAGMGIACLAAHRCYSDERYLERAVAMARSLERRAEENEKGLFWSDSGGVRIGMGYGQSGVALFLLRLSQVVGETKWRDMGRRSIEFDLFHGMQLEPGVTSFAGESEADGTVFPYIEQGSGGIAKVALRYGMRDGIEEILAATHRKYSGFPGLIFGLTGFVDVLTDAHLYSNDQRFRKMATLPLQGLHDIYLFRTEDGLAAPGENLFRVSCDYATGLAGIMYTLYRREHSLPDSLTLDWLDTEGKPSGLASHQLEVA